MPDRVQSLDCAEDEFVWNTAASAGISLPAICHQGRCLTCAGLVLSGAWDQSASVSYFQQDREAGYILLCTARPRSDLEIRTHQQWEMRKHRKELGLPAPYS